MFYLKKVRNLFIVGVLLLLNLPLEAQTFSKYPVNQSGRYAFFPLDPGGFDVTKSEDGSDVYTGEVLYDDTYYSIIMVDFADDVIRAEDDKEMMQALLIDYLKFLESQFGIATAKGYETGKTHEINADAIGVLDYWEDAETTQFVVKGWINKKSLAVMIIYGSYLPEQNVQDKFLNGFRFN